jgi:hypothetical protein
VFSELADFSPCSTGWEHIRITVTTSAVKKKNPLFQSDFLGLSQLTNETGLELATHVL